jgi:predicted RNA-binding Zn-ribbon protein involved in translation (DUF1610 family)
MTKFIKSVNIKILFLLVLLLLLFNVVFIQNIIAEKITRYYCPKCFSFDIIISEEIPQKETHIVNKSLDEWKNEFQDNIEIPILKYVKSIAICKSCGYKVERLFAY